MERNLKREFSFIVEEDETVSNLNSKQSKPEKSEEVKSTSWIDQITDPDWKEFLEPEFKKTYFSSIVTFLENAYQTKSIFPKQCDIFNAFNMTPLAKVKCVLIGQDPYHSPGQAHGLSFSVPKNVPIPPSLQNIFTELANDIKGFKIPDHGCLEPWAKEGVLLLNASLTVEQGIPNSHATIGWLTFLRAVIHILNIRRKNLVFILLGKFAKEYAKQIDTKQRKSVFQ